MRVKTSPETTVCQFCHKSFTYIPRGLNKYRYHKYCSRSCYYQSVVNSTIENCPICGKLFKKSAQHLKYCSVECRNKGMEKKVSKICPVCNKEFHVPVSNASRYNVCSMKCRLSETIYLNCSRCGKRFNNHTPKRKRNYCSELCRRPASTKVCEQCGKIFRYRPNETPRFCSIACYRQYISGNGGETSIEKDTRQILEKLQLVYKQEAKLGRYSVDFILPQFNLAIECDGKYWHRNPKRDLAKNRYIKAHHYKLLRLPELLIKSGGVEVKIKQHINNCNLILRLQE